MRLVWLYGFVMMVTNIFSQSLSPQNILEQLIMARGEPRNDYPAIKVIDRVKNIASYVPSAKVILIESMALEICQSMGSEADDALAFLIGHELTHYFQHHLWAREEVDISFFATNDQLENWKDLEIEADAYGAFLSYLAGYDYASVAPEIIERLYNSYQIDLLAIDDYANPALRQDVALSVCRQVEDYRLLFETAQVLEHFGVYDWAITLNNYLLKYLDFNEIYSNLAVCELKKAISLIPSNIVYPLSVKKSLSLRSTNQFSIDSLLQLGENHLKKVVERNPADYEAFINLAALYLIRGEYSNYEYLIAHLSPLIRDPADLCRVEILEGIRKLNQGDAPSALDFFQSAKSKTADSELQLICQKNIDLIRRKEKKTKSADKGKSIFSPTFISEHVSEILLDGSDSFFPKIMRKAIDNDLIQIELDDGQERIVLWMTDNAGDSSEYRNAFIHTHQGSRHKWFIRGIEPF